ncbi:class I SAM-dependent methyltransferase [Nonomuraea sp. ZG12]|uniref:class I SAM-dependent methyltransferase n=1 Tax=Nonomuraea sp. ZG12 TaxID=3452207 RepID=UPI003F8B2489
MSTPLTVSLLRRVCESRSDVTALFSMKSRAEVEDALVDAAVAAAYRHERGSGWDAGKARQWLSFLARHLHEHRERDLAWWRLSRRLLSPWVPTRGRQCRPPPRASELSAALDAFRPTGSLLELACGPGRWTAQLLQHATDVTAVDASPEMLAIASTRVGEDERVRFVSADLFRWQPDRCYDVVFFGTGCHTFPPNASRPSGRF